jgi:hypothetical protein
MRKKGYFMETFFVLGTIAIAVVFLELNSNRRFNMLRDSIVTPDVLKKNLDSQKSSIKDSLQAKQNKYQTDMSETTEAYIRSLSAYKTIEVYNDIEAQYIWAIATQKFGEAAVCYEPKLNKFIVECYQIYLAK